MEEQIPRIGEVHLEPCAFYHLILEDHVEYVNPSLYGLTEDSINPADYFITSGDAVQKAKVLEKDLWHLAGELRKQSYDIICKEHKCDHQKSVALYSKGIRPKSPKNFKEYEAAVWKAAGSSRKLLNALIKARGTNIFLETEWNHHRLLVIPKNPRKFIAE